MSTTRSIEWKVRGDGEEHDLVVCEVGDSLRLHWDAVSSYEYDVFDMGSEASYVACDFSGQYNVVNGENQM